MDQRIIKTKRALCNALGRLLQEKEFDRISVSDIVREAGITRKTFYNHYQDKIEMVQDYQMKLSEKIQEHIRCHEKIDREFFVDLFVLLDQQDALLTGLFSIHGSPMMQEIIKGTMKQYCLDMTVNTKKDPIFLEYQAIMLANIIFGIVQHWLTTGKKSSPEEVADIFVNLRFPIIL